MGLKLVIYMQYLVYIWPIGTYMAICTNLSARYDVCSAFARARNKKNANMIYFQIGNLKRLSFNRGQINSKHTNVGVSLSRSLDSPRHPTAHHHQFSAQYPHLRIENTHHHKYS